MTFRRLARNVVNALDFAQGRKTKIGAFIVLVGKIVGQFNPEAGELLVQVGQWFAAYGLALVAARKLSPPKPSAGPSVPDPMPEQKLSKPDFVDKPYGTRI